MVKAEGHTKGNSVSILQDGDIYYMFHGDVTYCDAALKANKLSVIFEDKDKARETLNRVLDFIKTNEGDKKISNEIEELIKSFNNSRLPLLLGKIIEYFYYNLKLKCNRTEFIHCVLNAINLT